MRIEENFVRQYHHMHQYYLGVFALHCGAQFTPSVLEKTALEKRMTSLAQVKRKSTTKHPRSWSVTRQAGFRQFKKSKKIIKVLPMNLPNSRTTVKRKLHYESDGEEQD